MEHYIVEITPDAYETLAVYTSYEEADDAQDHFCSVYPNGYIDILSEEELIHAAKNSRPV
jgi:hypothetical protein